MRENAGEISLCGNVREKRAKCGSLPPNAGGLATMIFEKGKISNLRQPIYSTKHVFEKNVFRLRYFEAKSLHGTYKSALNNQIMIDFFIIFVDT